MRTSTNVCRYSASTMATYFQSARRVEDQRCQLQGRLPGLPSKKRGRHATSICLVQAAPPRLPEMPGPLADGEHIAPGGTPPPPGILQRPAGVADGGGVWQYQTSTGNISRVPGPGPKAAQRLSECRSQGHRGCRKAGRYGKLAYRSYLLLTRLFRNMTELSSMLVRSVCLFSLL